MMWFVGCYCWNDWRQIMLIRTAFAFQFWIQALVSNCIMLLHVSSYLLSALKGILMCVVLLWKQRLCVKGQCTGVGSFDHFDSKTAQLIHLYSIPPTFILFTDSGLQRLSMGMFYQCQIKVSFVLTLLQRTKFIKSLKLEPCHLLKKYSLATVWNAGFCTFFYSVTFFPVSKQCHLHCWRSEWWSGPLRVIERSPLDSQSQVHRCHDRRKTCKDTFFPLQ